MVTITEVSAVGDGVGHLVLTYRPLGQLDMKKDGKRETTLMVMFNKAHSLIEYRRFIAMSP